MFTMICASPGMERSHRPAAAAAAAAMRSSTVIALCWVTLIVLLNPLVAAQSSGPSRLCIDQKLCTCYNTLSPPACYSPTSYHCEGTNKLVAGPEPTGSCAITGSGSSPSPSPAYAVSPSPKPPVASPSPAPTTVQPSKVCNDQKLCTCYNTLNPPACYSPTSYHCQGTNKLVAGPEPTGSCAITGSGGTASPSPAPISSPSPKPVASPSPAPAAAAQPSKLCNEQKLCTCYNTLSPPACYSPTIYHCEGTNKLVAGPEPTGSCAITGSGGTASPSPVPLSSPSPKPVASPSPALAQPSPSPAPSGPPSTVTCDAVTGLGLEVAPVAGTLTDNRAPASSSSLPPFGRADNQYTSRLIRMPVSTELDPNGLLARPFPTSAWFTNLLWSPADNPSYGEDPVQVFPYHIRARGPPHPNTAGVDRGLWFCKPYYTGDQDGGVIMATWPELQLTLKELQDSNSPGISALDWDDLSVTMKFSAAPSVANGPSMVVPLAKGSPYLTARIPAPARPILRTPRPTAGGASIASVVQVAPNKIKIVVGQVPFSGQNTWLLWSSKPVNFSRSGSDISIWDSATAAAGATGTFSGFLRLAWVPNAGAAGAASIESMLDAHVDSIPVGGSVKAWSNLGEGSGTGSYSLTWSTQSMAGTATTSPTTAMAATTAKTTANARRERRNRKNNKESISSTARLSATATGPQELLMLALPHHIDTLASPSSAAGASSFPLGVAAAGSALSGTGGSVIYTSQPQTGSPSTFGGYLMSVRGPMVPVVGSCWLLQEKLAPLSTETAAAANIKSAAMRADIEQTLLGDLPLVLPPSLLPANNLFADYPAGPRAWPWKGMMNPDAYFGGSEMQAMARLIYIARALEGSAAAAGSSFGPTAAAAAANVTNALKLLLQHKLKLPCTFSPPTGYPNYGALCYDNVFKLITTSRAQSASNTDSVDFFSRTGTDHHFHYGYWVGAAAAIASEDPAWYQQNLAPYINALIRDYANNDKADPVFPYARHKDWYNGHSWAAGLQLSFDGKNQESTSEAINGYLAIALLGQATGNAVLEGWGRLLLAGEITAARKYTQVYTGNDIYKQIAGGSAANGITKAKVASILFAAKASAYNWFDPDILTRHAIQWMPFSPASNDLLAQSWLSDAVPMVAAGTKVATDRYWSPTDGGGGASLGWRVLLTMAQAMVPGQQDAAWNALTALPINQSGGYALCGTIGRLTRTAAKWWIATRPGA